MVTPQQILKKYWGYENFRGSQQQIIESVLNGKDVLAILPTGGGKSICFQVPAMIKEGLCLVITPLIALMQDQVAQLKKIGINAVAVHAGMHHREIDIVLDNCVFGNIKFLYLSPERLQTELFKERVKRMNINLVAIDEAHCISQWGYDFRPPYLQIAEMRIVKPSVPFLALTASATKLVKTDIIEKLEMKTPAVFQQSFARDNISWVVRRTESKEKKLLEVLRKVPGTAIVYVRSRKSTSLLSGFLTQNSISATFYHAGLSHAERIQRQHDWLNNRFRVMVATNAFGMGINKADVRVVVHMDLPENLEAYYQEAGRAGRDGKRAYALMIYHEADIQNLKIKVNQSQPELKDVKSVYQMLANYYQLAVGSAQGESFDFDIDDFCAHFQVKKVDVYPSLKKMEEFGLIELNENFFRPSVLHISVDNKRLYEFQVAHARYDLLIKALMRLYGGELYTDFTMIDERQLGQLLKITPEEVRIELQQLHKLQLMVYEPQLEKPQLVFVLPRQDAERLFIDSKEFMRRRDLHIQKMESMINYVQQNNRCRMQIIQEYFDEVSYKECGICDVCISKSKKVSNDAIEDYQQQILYLLKVKPLSADELEAEVSPTDREIFIDVLRDMVDAGVVYYDEYWVLHLTKRK